MTKKRKATNNINRKDGCTLKVSLYLNGEKINPKDYVICDAVVDKIVNSVAERNEAHFLEEKAS